MKSILLYIIFLFFQPRHRKKRTTLAVLFGVEGDIARQLYSKTKAKELAEVEAQKALEQVKAGKSLAELFPPSKEDKPAAMRFETETKPAAVDTGEFSATTDSVPQLGPAPERVKDTFAAQAAGPLAKPYAAGEGYAVVVVT